MFCLTLCARVYTISLLLRLFVSMHFVPLVCFLPKCLPVSVSLSMFACLFVYLAANLFLSLYLLHKFTVMVSFDFVTQLLFSSIISHRFLLHFFICLLGENSIY